MKGSEKEDIGRNIEWNRRPGKGRRREGEMEGKEWRGGFEKVRKMKDRKGTKERKLGTRKGRGRKRAGEQRSDNGGGEQRGRIWKCEESEG